MKINKKLSIDSNSNLNNIQNNQRKDNLNSSNQKIKNTLLNKIYKRSYTEEVNNEDGSCKCN
jgi:hypothetical protein